MDTGGTIGIIYGIILIIIGGLGIYSLDWLNNIYVAYLLLIGGILALIGGAYLNINKKKKKK
jgi:hypothetical protein